MTVTRKRTQMVVLFALFALAGCDTIFGSHEQRVVGILGPEASVVEAPESAEVQAKVRIGITTGGYPGCSRQGDTQVERDHSLVVVRPFDYVTEPGLNSGSSVVSVRGAQPTSS